MAKFVKGEKLYTVGLDMNCKDVICQRIFVAMHKDGRVITQDPRTGVKVIGGPPSDYFRNKKDCQRSMS